MSSNEGSARLEHARAVVVDAKVRAPSFRGLVRRRCCDLLGRLNGGGLALILAPAGFGKTTLIAQFADSVAANSGCPVAWYRVEVTDGHPEAAIAHLERAFQVAMPSLPGGWHTEADAAAALERSQQDRILLVLDDFHQLIGTRAEEMLARFIELAPSSLCVAVGSRQVPSFNVSRLQLLDALVVIGPGDLRFRSWETEQLFRDFYGEPLPHEEITTLTRGIGGWAAGLQLFHLATRGQPFGHRRDAARKLRGRSSVAREYLARNVVGELPGSLKPFLVATSVLGRLDDALCDDFLGEANSANFLAELAHRQLVVRDADGSYRCHDVLRAHLQGLLAEESGEAALRSQFRRAGKLLERRGNPGDAFVAYLGAGDFTELTRLLGCHGERVELRARLTLDQLPAAFVDSEPWLLLAAARRDLANGDLAGAAGYYRRAEAGFVDQSASAASRREHLALSVWLEPRLNPSPSSWVAILRQATRRNPHRAVETLVGDAAITRFARGLAALLADDGEVASQGFAAARDHPDASPIVVVVANLALAFVRQDDFEELVRHADEIATDADALDVPALARLARALPALTGSPDAVREAHVVQAECEVANDLWGTALALLLCGVGHGRAGDLQTKQSLIDDAAQRFRDLDADAIAQWAVRVGADAHERPDVARPLPRTDAVECGVRIRCFGPLSVRVAGRQLALTSVRPRARSALRLLALHAGQPLHWEYLAEALWPSRSPMTARRSLQVAISELRRLLHSSRATAAGLVIARDGESYRLDLGRDTSVDVVSFHALLKDAEHERRAERLAGAIVALQRALDLYDDPFPEEGQSDWAVQARDRYRVLVTDAAELLAALRLDVGDPKGAAAAAEWALRCDRFRDASWHLLVAARDVAGEHAAATRARHAYDSVLCELGVSPVSPALLTTSTV